LTNHTSNIKKFNILLVEDDALDIICVERSLKKLDKAFELYKAHNGKQAWDLLNSENDPIKPDVIILDLNMPKMNGIEFLKVIRNDPRFINLKVFIMTTSSESVDRTTAEHYGISGYIIKPLGYADNKKRVASMEAFVEFHLRKIFMA
jgi:CheY-like chemotaxis protein